MKVEVANRPIALRYGKGLGLNLIIAKYKCFTRQIMAKGQKTPAHYELQNTAENIFLLNNSTSLFATYKLIKF